MLSMTGFAKRQFSVGERKITVEIKTLNSKQLDLNVKLPSSLREADIPIRSILARLERGKVDLLASEENGSASPSTLDAEMASQRFEEIERWLKASGRGVDDGVIASCVLRQSDVWSSSSDVSLSEQGLRQLLDGVGEAVEEVIAFRRHEGDVLERDFVVHVDAIEQRLAQIPQYEASRIETAKERIHRYFAECAITDIDNNRFEQELIYYLEKLDITEEKVRLKKHIDYFRQVMRDEPSCGKKLSFIAQEMGREINTTGSKANHVDIQRLVVEMKDELEKIKEQLGNIL